MSVDTTPVDQGLADPASITTDGQSVSTKPIGDLIAGIQFQAAAAAVKKRRRGAYFSKIINPGAFDGRCGGGGFGSGCFCGGGN